MTKMVINFLPTLFILGSYLLYDQESYGTIGMGGPLNFGKSTAKKFNQETDVKIRFKDVAGMSKRKKKWLSLSEVSQNPEKYEKLGVKFLVVLSFQALLVQVRL